MSHTPPRDTADSDARKTGGLAPPITAGVVSALVGFTSSFVVVLSGLTAVGANHEQAASGLLAVTVVMGLACIVLSWQTRLPITAVWYPSSRRWSPASPPRLPKPCSPGSSCSSVSARSPGWL